MGDRGSAARASGAANLSALVRALHAEGPLSRTELGERTGLTRSGIRRLVGDLVAAGLVVEERGESLGLPGRPSPLVHLAPERAVVLALEIAVDSLAVAVVGMGGHVLDLVRVDRPRGTSTVDDIVADLAELADGVATSWRTDALVGIGVAVVGVVRRDDGFVSTAPNLGWRDVPLGPALAAAFGAAVPIAVANEADLGALAEHRRGAAAGVEDVIFLSGRGRPRRRADRRRPAADRVAGFGGEVGHMPVNPVAGATCRCGSVGCWETEVGEQALLARAGRPADGGRAAVEAVARRCRRRRRHGARRARRGRALAGDRARRARQHAQPGARRARRPPRPPPPRSSPRPSRTTLDRRALGAPRALVEIVPATLGVDAAVLGAAELAFEPILADPASWFHGPGGHRAGGSTRSPTKRGYTTHEQALADPSGSAPRTGGGDSHARSSIGGAHHERGTGAGRRMRRRRRFDGADATTAAGGAAATDGGGRPRTAGTRARPAPAAAAATASSASRGTTTRKSAGRSGTSRRSRRPSRPAAARYISNDAKSSAETQASNVENLISQGANVLDHPRPGRHGHHAVGGQRRRRTASRSSPTTA